MSPFCHFMTYRGIIGIVYTNAYPKRATGDDDF